MKPMHDEDKDNALRPWLIGLAVWVVLIAIIRLITGATSEGGEHDPPPRPEPSTPTLEYTGVSGTSDSDLAWVIAAMAIIVVIILEALTR